MILVKDSDWTIEYILIKDVCLQPIGEQPTKMEKQQYPQKSLGNHLLSTLIQTAY